MYGHAYTSVFGAGTSASEFEFLTGNSMAFLPSGSIPYQQSVLGPAASLASILKAEGYSTLAFHPGERASWQRIGPTPAGLRLLQVRRRHGCAPDLRARLRQRPVRL